MPATSCESLLLSKMLSPFLHRIMPPGKHHTVLSPVAGFSRGGHFFNLDTMHLTEMSRFVDTRVGKYVTNDSHLGTLETLCRLVISLTVLPKWRSESSFFSSN